MLKVSVILLRICYLFDMRKLGNGHNAKVKEIYIFTRLLAATASAACKQPAHGG